MSSGNGRGGGGGRERRGERTRAPLRWQFWRRKALLLVLCAGQSLPQQSLAFGFFTLPRGVNVALSIRSRLPSRGGHKAAVRGVAGCRTPARSRGKRTLLRAEFIEDEYARLVRRMARLERIVSGQNAEVEAMRSSMEHMRMIIQIQAQIDSCLVDGGEEGLLSTNLGGGAGGTADEPNPRLVRQAIKLLRMRHRVLQAWEFEGDGGHERQGKDNDGDDDEDAAEALANEFRAMSGLSGLSTPPPLPPLPPDEPIPRNSGGVESAIRRRDGRYEDEEEYAYSMYDPLDSRAAASEERRRGVWGGRGENLGFGSNLSQQQPPKTNQDAADAAGTGVVAALMEV